MNQFTDYERQQLTNQTECYIHTHPRVPLGQTSATELEAATPIKAVTAATYTLTAADEQISVGQTCTVTLPPTLKSKEYHVTLTANATLTILPTGADTVMGTTSLVATVQWTSLHFKSADNGNWILI
jgi:hypothetical protein